MTTVYIVVEDGDVESAWSSLEAANADANRRICALADRLPDWALVEIEVMRQDGDHFHNYRVLDTRPTSDLHVVHYTRVVAEELQHEVD